MQKNKRAQAPKKSSPGRLVRSLESAVPATRDKAALELRDFMAEAKAALWRSIRKRSNQNHRGTMVRTLQWFDCSGDFDDLVDLTLNGHYEVQCHALRILQGQSFRVTKAQLREARRSIRELRPRENFPASALRLLRTEFEAALKRIEGGRVADTF